MVRNLMLGAKAYLLQRLFKERWANRFGVKPHLPWDPSLVVHSLYKTAFGRLADPQGLANCLRQLQSEASVEALTEGLATSEEFQARHGAGQKVDTGFLEGLYRHSLGRQPDPEGLSNWLAAGENGATRANVVASFATSEEAMNAIATMCANSFYVTAFGRFPDEAGLANYVRQLKSGVSLEAFAEGVTASAEFQTRHGSSQNVDTEYLTALYCNGLGRHPDPQALAFWLAEGEKGGTRVRVLIGVATSEEALQRAFSPTPENGIDYSRGTANETLSGADKAVIRPCVPACVNRDFCFHLDTLQALRLNAYEYYLTGWFKPSTSLGSAQQLLVVVDGVAIPAFTDFARLDVARAFGDSAMVNSGFFARFRAPLLHRHVSLIVRTSEGDVILSHSIPVPDSIGEDSIKRGAVSTYQEWLVQREPKLFWAEDEVSDRISALCYQPVISVILPTYNTSSYFLKQCIESVLEQRYANWQLCVADDCSDNPSVLEYLEKVAAEDSRVVLSMRQNRGGISAASNTALAAATGEFVAFMDHDDELHRYALLETVRCLNREENVDLIYSDEDKIDTYGLRSQPAFKPDFDMDMFLSFNYLGHLVTLRRNLISEIGGFRSVCDGAQDWDLLIRAVEKAGPRAVRHIKKALYHWRMHEESTAQNLDAKPYARKAWSVVISEHIQRTSKRASAEQGLFYGSMRVKPKPTKDLTVAVLLREEDGALQAAALNLSLSQRWIKLYEIVNCMVYAMKTGIAVVPEDAQSATGYSSVVGKGSTGPYAVTPEEGYRPVRSLSELAEDVFIFINRPLEIVNHSFFHELAAQAMRDDVGIVTGISLGENRRTLHTGLIGREAGELMDPFVGIEFPAPGYMGQLNVVRSVESISDEFFAVRRNNLAAIGGLSSVSATRMPRLVCKLVKNAKIHGLHVLVTPYAVATFHSAAQTRCLEPIVCDAQLDVRLNSNLLDFANLAEVLRSGL
jgi:glycosyltransferase involved in cell wall biosynthesis